MSDVIDDLNDQLEQTIQSGGTYELPDLRTFTIAEIHKLMSHVIEKGYLSMLQAFVVHTNIKNYIYLESLQNYAIKYNQLPILIWISTTTSSTDNCCRAASYYNNLFLLQWMRRQTPPYKWDESVPNFAAQNGNLEMLQWAVSNGCPFFVQDAMKEAASFGQLNILKWLRPNGLDPSDLPQVSKSAAQNGHLHVLKWIKDSNYPWNKELFCIAGSRGYMHIVNWILAQNLPYDLSHDYYNTLGNPSYFYENYHANKFRCINNARWRWVKAIDASLSTVFLCFDLQELIKNYI